MIEQDTVRLLRECDAGVQMGVSSIDEVQGRIKAEGLRKLLSDSKAQHEKLNIEIQQLLDRYRDDGKAPDPMAKGMSWLKTNVKMGMDESDATVADLLTDGCNMGIKSLYRYMNQYKAADSTSKGICKSLAGIEEELCRDLRKYL